MTIQNVVKYALPAIKFHVRNAFQNATHAKRNFVKNVSRTVNHAIIKYAKANALFNVHPAIINSAKTAPKNASIVANLCAINVYCTANSVINGFVINAEKNVMNAAKSYAKAILFNVYAAIINSAKAVSRNVILARKLFATNVYLIAMSVKDCFVVHVAKSVNHAIESSVKINALHNALPVQINFV